LANRACFTYAQTGRSEIYVQAFPEARVKQQISTDGEGAAWWSRDSRDLYFVSPDGPSLWRARMEKGESGRFMRPERLATLPQNLVGMDAMPDRQRFLALINKSVGIGSMTIVQNWRAALK